MGVDPGGATGRGETPVGADSATASHQANPVPAILDGYRSFLEAKVKIAAEGGFDAPVSAFHVSLQERGHQALMAQCAVRRGCCAVFASFGLGKTGIELEWARVVRAQVGGLALGVIPLGVRQEFFRDAERLGVRVKFIRTNAEIDEAEAEATRIGADGATASPPIYLTNYETVRDGKIDVSVFGVVFLDEASVLRGFGGSKTFREFMAGFETTPFKLVATATPAPNEYIELLAYAAFLGVMDVGEAKTRFFKRDSEKADQLTLHPHKEAEFWLWVASWALFVSRPSDLGCSDDGYDLPPLKVIYHEVQVDHRSAGFEKDGQARMFREATAGVVEASKEKRETLGPRIDALRAILAGDPDSRYLIWHDLEAERAAIEAAVPEAVSVYGTQDLDEREQAIVNFSNGWLKYLAAKPVIAGSGCNFQRFCHKAVFVGVGFKFNDFIQAVHRIQRFLQPEPCEIHIIHAESERAILRILQRKWRDHDVLTARMSDIIREHGLASAAMAGALTRGMGVERSEVVVSDGAARLVNNDTVVECATMAADSVDLIVTSIPFSTQYEYTPSYNDFGHTDDDAHFWAQMDYLTPSLLRVLKPGRDACIHVKDRITPGGLTGLGFQTVAPFSDACTAHFRKHGFAFIGRITIATDVVRENNQTYRLGWSEQCKDGTRQGAGLPEYLLLFRKPPSDRSNGYADVPVVKDKAAYPRARWQVDAAGFWRSDGNRLLALDELAALDSAVVYRIWREFNLRRIYDLEHHVRLGEALEARGRLPPDFALIPAHSWHPDVWSDVARMRTLNGEQYAKGKEMHLCPLQFDIVDRCIVGRSMPGELVFDPFGGLMTVPHQALKLGRRGMGVELNPGYFRDGVAHVEAMARSLATPTLFDLEPAAGASAEVAA